MKDRLGQFLAAENITKSEFADSLGIGRANVTNILGGRNKPSYEFIATLVSHYPSLNIDWLITGKGRMYRSEDSYLQLSDNRPSQPTPQPQPKNQNLTDISPDLFTEKSQESNQATTTEEKLEPIDKEQDKEQDIKTRKVKKILVFYNDNTYEEFLK